MNTEVGAIGPRVTDYFRPPSVSDVLYKLFLVSTHVYLKQIDLAAKKRICAEACLVGKA